MTQVVEAAVPPWHSLAGDEVTRRLEVDPDIGLSAIEAAERLRRDGPNQLDEPPREPRWRAFLRQFTDLLIVILLLAAAVSLVVTGEWETPAVIVGVVVLNAVIGFVQESRAGASVEALKKLRDHGCGPPRRSGAQRRLRRAGRR